MAVTDGLDGAGGIDGLAAQAAALETSLGGAQAMAAAAASKQRNRRAGLRMVESSPINAGARVTIGMDATGRWIFGRNPEKTLPGCGGKRSATLLFGEGTSAARARRNSGHPFPFASSAGFEMTIWLSLLPPGPPPGTPISRLAPPPSA